MHGGFESAARWNRHYYEMAEKFDQQLAEFIQAHAAEIAALPAATSGDEAFRQYYDWTRSTPTGNALRDQLYNYHGRGYAARSAWAKIRGE